MGKLKECIQQNTIENNEEIKRCILGMVCSKDSPIPLEENKLFNALNIDGEFLVLKLHYNNFQEEMKTQKIKYKISQALSIIVSYEDDGPSYEDITEFVKYIYDISDEKQNSTFGVKKVDKLSEFPITILFSGILPINQLKMTVGKKIDALINSDDEYFIPRFQQHRDNISNEIGVPILPVFPMLDKELDDFKVRLIDLFDGRLICEFDVCEKISKDTVEIYLQKLFYVYKTLVQEQQLKK